MAAIGGEGCGVDDAANGFATGEAAELPKPPNTGAGAGAEAVGLPNAFWAAPKTGVCCGGGEEAIIWPSSAILSSISVPVPPFGVDENAGAELPTPNIDGEEGFAPKLKGAGDAALEPPKANAPVEVVGDGALDAPNAKAPVDVVGNAAPEPKAKGEPDPTEEPNEKGAGEG